MPVGKEIIIFTDGACFGNPGQGGFRGKKLQVCASPPIGATHY